MKIALIGYGKMGKTIEQIAIQRGHQIVSIIDINNAEDIYSEAFKSADAAIEFTTPATAFNNYMNVLSDFIVRVNAEFPETIENEDGWTVSARSRRNARKRAKPSSTPPTSASA